MPKDEILNKRLSPHFTFAELTKTSKTAYKLLNLMLAQQHINNLILLTNYLLEPARAILQTPLIITSGYRCPSLNREVGGKENSQHLNATAADFVVKNQKISLEDVFNKLRNSPFLNYGQLILEKNWIHLSLGVPFRDLDKCRESFKVI